MKSLLSIAAVALASLTATGAKAELVTYEFTAELDVFNNRDGVLNSNMSLGDEFTGTFTIDYSKSGSSVLGTTYYYGALTEWTYQLDADLLEGTGGKVAVHNGGVDSVRVDSNNYSGDLSINGSNYHGAYDAEVALLVDFDGEALGGSAIPDFSALNLGDLEIAGTGAGVRFWFDNAEFGGGFTSITRVGGSVATVPELDPASLGSAGALVASAGTALRSRRRRAA